MASDAYLRALQQNRQPISLTSEYSRSHNLSANQHRPLSEILGHPVDEGFIEYYNKDTENRGYVLPTDNYIGPGNSLNRGAPTSVADRIAQKHDLEYAWEQHEYQEGVETKEEAEKHIAESDTRAIDAFAHSGTFASIIGHDGLTIKKGFESVVGHTYPSFQQNTNSASITGKMAKTVKTIYKAWWDGLSAAEKRRVRNDPQYKHVFTESSSATTSGSKRPNEAQQEAGSSKQAKVEEATSSNSTVSYSVSSSSGTTGGATAGTSSAANTSKTPSTQVTSSTQASNIPTDLEMGLTGTGSEQASGGADSHGMMEYTIERPLSIFGRKTSMYRKSHKFMTFGLAPAILTGSTSTERWLTSYLAEVPWHIPALYMNPSEFSLLRPGTRVKSVHVEVYYRGSTIQFEVAASTSGLATLNQINDIACAYALNKTGQGSNVSYTSFDSSQPMIPSGITKPKYDTVGTSYRGMVFDYYGTNNTFASFDSYIPKHQIGRQAFLYNYWAMSTRTAGAGAAAVTDLYGGWPCLADKIMQFDGKTVVNKKICEMSYEPKMAPLKRPLKTIAHGLPYANAAANNTINVAGKLVTNRRATVTRGSLSGTTPGQFADGIPNATLGETNVNIQNSVIPPLTIYTPIEKSQYSRSGYWGEQDAHIQPSLHIGVQPVPALSSASTLLGDGVFNSWTDTRAYWEVIATMVVEEHEPTEYPHAIAANVPFGENVLFNANSEIPNVNLDPRDDGATFAGLYTQQVADPGPDIY